GRLRDAARRRRQRLARHLDPAHGRHLQEGLRWLIRPIALPARTAGGRPPRRSRQSPVGGRPTRAAPDRVVLPGGKVTAAQRSCGQEGRVEFRLLGPVEVRDGDATVPIGGSKPRALLAALLLDLGTVVPAQRLVDVVWGEAPPDTARGLVQTYVS